MTKLNEWCKNNPDKTISICYERCKNIVSNSDHILISFSGGKDSTLAANMLLDAHECLQSKAKLYFNFVHCEWFYSESIKFIDKFLELFHDRFEEIFYKCMPLKWSNGIDASIDLISWDKNKNWVQDIPDNKCIIREGEWSYYGQHEKEETKTFAEYFRKTHDGIIYNIVSIRQDESPDRRVALLRANSDTGKYSEICNINIASPIFDMHVSDVWRTIVHFKWEYNKLYDILFEAGIPVHKQRVASLLNVYATRNLYLIKLFEPELFKKLLERFSNIDIITSNMRGFFNMQLPKPIEWNGVNHIFPDKNPERENNLIRFLDENNIKYSKNYDKIIFDKDTINIELPKVQPNWKEYALHLLMTSTGNNLSLWQEQLITEITKQRWQGVGVDQSIVDAIHILDELSILQEVTDIGNYVIHQKHEKSGKIIIATERIPFQSIDKCIQETPIEILKQSKRFNELCDMWKNNEILSPREQRLNLPQSVKINKNSDIIKLGISVYFRENIKSMVSWKRLACALLKNDIQYFYK